jgi:predicted TIM-barrel fold metal-dependent hydrolase
VIVDAYTLAPTTPLPAEGLQNALARQGIDRVALFPGPASPVEPSLLNRAVNALPGTDMLPAAVWLANLRKTLVPPVFAPSEAEDSLIELAAMYPRLAVPFTRFNPAAPGAYARLIELHRQRPLKGLQLNQALHGFHFSGLPLHQAADIARGLNLPVLVHLRSPESAREFAAFSQLHTGVQFIVAHLFCMEWFAETPAEFPNLNFEVSPLRLVSGLRIQRAVQAFGEHSVIFGSGEPCLSPGQVEAIRRIQHLPISGTAKNMILGDNMAALLG